MWIKSQSEHAIVKCEQVEIVACDGYFGIYSNDIELGMYLTFEKAKKVLKMISDSLISNMRVELAEGKYLDNNTDYPYVVIFFMPKDCEVQEDVD